MTRVVPTPFYFGPDGAGLFGWLHHAPVDARPRFGLVVCNPFGFEEVCAHRSLKQLADDAAASGVPSLRFDLAGCGNSEGDEFEPGRLDAWLRSTHDAIDALKATTGVTQVCLLGLRLGASLAVLAASRRDDVCGLIAIAPVVRGRDFVRELRMLGDSHSSPSSATAPDDLLESAGFVLTAQTVESLRVLDLRSIDKAPAPRVLIVERDDLPAQPHWHDALARLGVETRTEAWPGYAAIMSNPQDAKLPERIIEGVLATLAEWQIALDDSPCASAPMPASPARAEMQTSASNAVRESIVGITSNDVELFGILTAPVVGASLRAASKRTAILMLNSGSVHHIGPNRLWVTLARRWAARGITVLRIDLSGIGDSPAHVGAKQNHVYSAEAARDIAAALAWLRAKGIGECHLLGLCSGAFHALNAAIASQPIASASMINPLTYSWEDCARLGLALNDHEILALSKKYRSRAFTLDTWRRLMRGELDLKLISGVIAGRVRDSLRAWWAKARSGIGLTQAHGLAASLEATAERGIRLNFVFAEGAPGHALLRKEAGAAIDDMLARSRMSINFVPDADHTFTRLAARERLIALLDALVVPRSGADDARSFDTEPTWPAVAARMPRQAPADSGLRASANATTAATPTTASTSSISR